LQKHNNDPARTNQVFTPIKPVTFTDFFSLVYPPSLLQVESAEAW